MSDEKENDKRDDDWIFAWLAEPKDDCQKKLEEEEKNKKEEPEEAPLEVPLDAFDG